MSEYQPLPRCKRRGCNMVITKHKHAPKALYCCADCQRLDYNDSRRKPSRECARPGCRHLIGPRRIKYCSSYCSQRDYRLKMRTGACADCGEAILSTSKWCIDCAITRNGEMQVGRPYSPERREKMREVHASRAAAKRGFELTPEVIEEIRHRIEAGETVKAIAPDYKLSPCSASILARYGSWANYKRRWMGQKPEWEPTRRRKTAKGAVRIKLTDAQVLALVQRIDAGAQKQAVALEYGVSVSHVEDILAGRSRHEATGRRAG